VAEKKETSKWGQAGKGDGSLEIDTLKNLKKGRFLTNPPKRGSVLRKGVLGAE